MISRTNLRFYLSGGPGNTSPALSLGGPISGTPVRSPLSTLFDDVSGLDAETGRVDYRCLYFSNDDPDSDGLIDPYVWLAESDLQSEFAVGLDRSGKNGTAIEIERETYPPSGVRFSVPVTVDDSIALPDGPYHTGETVPLWVRRTVPPGAKPMTEFVVLRVRGETY